MIIVNNHNQQQYEQAQAQLVRRRLMSLSCWYRVFMVLSIIGTISALLQKQLDVGQVISNICSIIYYVIGIKIFRDMLERSKVDHLGRYLHVTKFLFGLVLVMYAIGIILLTVAYKNESDKPDYKDKSNKMNAITFAIIGVMVIIALYIPISCCIIRRIAFVYQYRDAYLKYGRPGIMNQQQQYYQPNQQGQYYQPNQQGQYQQPNQQDFYGQQFVQQPAYNQNNQNQLGFGPGFEQDMKPDNERNDIDQVDQQKQSMFVKQQF